jgi:hypothetical protein
MWKILSLYWWLELVLGLQVVGGELQAGIGILWVFIIREECWKTVSSVTVPGAGPWKVGSASVICPSG